MRFVAIVELVAGIGIIGFWSVALVTHKVPEVTSGDRAIWFHIAAEGLLALALVAGGFVLLSSGDRSSARILASVAIGGMTYSTINSPGYYAREGTWGPVWGFAALTLLSVVCAVILAIG